MKKVLIILTVLLGACATSTMITGSWKSPTYGSNSYDNILVAAFTDHAVAKSTVENDLAVLLNKENIRTYKSIDLFPPTISTADSDRLTIMNKVRDKDIGAILTISLLKKETETRYVPGPYDYDPFLYDYYGNFWRYYSYSYPRFYKEGYYTENTIYYIETNLYDVKTEGLVWSAQSKTYEVLDLPKFSKEFANTIVTKMRKDGVLKSQTRNESVRKN